LETQHVRLRNLQRTKTTSQIHGSLKTFNTAMLQLYKQLKLQ